MGLFALSTSRAFRVSIPMQSSAGQGDQDLPACDRVLRAYSSFLCREEISAFLSRLIVLSLAYGALVLGAGLSLPSAGKWFGLSWVLIALCQLGLFGILARQSRQSKCFGAAFACALAGLGWWAMVLLLESAPPLLCLLLLGFLILGFGSMPWPGRYNVAIAGLHLVAAFAASVMYQYGALAMTVSALLVFASVRFAAENRLALLSEISHAFLGRYCESSSAVSNVTLQLLSAQSAQVADVRRVLLAFSSGVAEIVSDGASQSSAVDPVFVKGLNQRVEDRTGENGILNLGDFKEQFAAPLHEWFLHQPERIFFARFVTIVGGMEQRAYIYIPFSLGTRLAGIGKTYRAVLGLSAVARISLVGVRSRFVSSDALLISQRSVSQREEELNRLVHLVNNAAQDITAKCEDLRSVVNAGGLDSVPVRERISGHIHELELASRSLSFGVSDVKLLKELLHVRSFSKREKVLMAPIVEDIRQYAEHRAKRIGGKFTFLMNLPPEAGVSIISRDFLETVLRTLVNLAGGSAGRGGEIALQIELAGDVVEFSVRGAGDALGIDPSALSFREEEIVSADGTLNQLRAVQNFAQLSDGYFQLRPGESSIDGMFVLGLPGRIVGADDKGRPGRTRRWALFVDDNPQVTSFYGRVAEALELPYRTAASVNEASALLELGGLPCLVITDVQLGQGTGLDVVKQVRAKFGAQVPVIVVTGATEGELRTRVDRDGGPNTTLLNKPVGRSRLFSEIRQILARGE